MSTNPQPQYPLTKDQVALMIEEAVDEAMTKHEAKMEAMMRREFNTLQELFKSAYPGGDPHGHRISHEKAIQSATRWENFKADFMGKAFTAGVFGAVGFLMMAAWEWAKGEMRR